MNWTKGFTSTFYASYVDPLSWRDTERFEITGGSITRTDDDLRASASIDCIGYPQGTERWVRIYLDAWQGSDAEHVPLFTGLATSPDMEIDGELISNSVDCFSALKPAEDILLPRGWYVPAEASGAEAVKQLLRVTPAPTTIEGISPTLSEAIIAESGETNMSMADKILDAIGWRLRLDGDGSIYILPQASEQTASYDPLTNDAIETEMQLTRDWYDCPNVFRAVNDDMSGVARDDSPNSPLSTVSRGREVWMEETDCDLANNESIAEYAVRRLKEEQIVGVKVEYKRRYNPDLQPSDLVRLHYPGQNVDGTFKITRQSIELDYGCTTSEEAHHYEQ